MSADRSRPKGQGGSRGGKGRPPSKQKRGGNKRSGQNARGSQPAMDRNRAFWGNPDAEAEVQRAVELVRPAPDPTAVVRSLGAPPLGRFVDNAAPLFTVVYARAQRLSVSMATANGLLVVDDDGDPA